MKKIVGSEDVFITEISSGEIYYLGFEGKSIHGFTSIHQAEVFSMNKGKQRARELKKAFPKMRFKTVQAWPLIKELQEQMKKAKEMSGTL